MNIWQYIQQEKAQLAIGAMAGYVTYLIATAKGFYTYQTFSITPALIDNFQSNLPTLYSLDAIKLAGAFIFIGMALALIIDYIWGRLR